MTTMVTIKSSVSSQPLVTAVPSSSTPIQVYQASTNPSSDLYARQNWGIEFQTANVATSGVFLACSFTMMVPGKPIQAITFNGDQHPLLLSDYTPGQANQWFFMTNYQTTGSTSFLNQSIIATAPVCMDLSGGVVTDGTKVQGWQYSSSNKNQQWTIGNVHEYPTGIRSDLMLIAKSVIESAAASPTFASILLSDPAPIFAAAGYPLHSQDYNAFNKFFTRSFQPHVQALVYQTTPVDPNWKACLMCKISLYVLALPLVALAGIGLSEIVPEAAPVIALGAAIGLSARATAGKLVALGAAAFDDVLSLLSNICKWVHACNE